MGKIQRALLSVSDKKGIVELAKVLSELKVEILSTGGTEKALKEAGIPVTSVSDYTGFPELMEGRLKTLHPKVHGGILAKRDSPAHLKAMKEHHISPIDLVVVNLYPFQKTVAKEGVSLEEAIENIDIGGPTMLRAAAKNFAHVAVVVNPDRYPQIIEELRASKGSLSHETRFALAQEAFAHCSHYDQAIASYLGQRLAPEPGGLFPPRLSLSFEKVMDLRYGENPHQRAAFYRDLGPEKGTIASAELLGGKEISYNNFLDLEAAWRLVNDFQEPAAVIIKHTNPCGAGVSMSLYEAYQKALEGDPVSAFGSIVGLNQPLDPETAHLMASPNTFIEAIIAPDYEEESIRILKKGQWWGESVRILKAGQALPKGPSLFMRRVSGGLLLQEYDQALYREGDLRVVSKRAPTDEEWLCLQFGWTVCKHVKSNAIVFVKNNTLLGVGAGQMSRVDSVFIATKKAGERAKGAVLASDAFFPFRDGIDLAAEAGITAIIQPGGSKKDDEAIKACDEHNMAMVFTQMRHFLH